jgi:hypothetical protein
MRQCNTNGVSVGAESVPAYPAPSHPFIRSHVNYVTDELAQTHLHIAFACRYMYQNVMHFTERAQLFTTIEVRI